MPGIHHLLSPTVALVVSTVLAAPSGAQCNGPDDPFEDNDTCATAWPVTLPFVQQGLWVHRHDPDLFQFTLLPGYQLRASLQCVDEQGDVDLVLYEQGPACGDLWVNLRSSRTYTNYEALTWLNTTTAPKVLVVQVEMWRGSIPMCNHYDLSLTAMVPPVLCDANTQDDFLEENDTCATAVPLPLGFTPDLWVSATDPDFYSVTLPPGGTLDVAAHFVHNSGDIDLWLYDTSATCGTLAGELARAVSETNDEHLVWQNTSSAPRNVILQVDLYSHSSSSCNDYDLVVNVGGVGLGANFCTAAANISGMSGRMSARGSDRVADNSFTLEARQLTPNSMGSFICSLERDSVPAAGGGQGTLCLGGDIGRFGGAVFPTGPQGRIEQLLDLTRLPQASGIVAVAVGETWRFQAWYRDRVGNQPTSNLTDGLEVTFR